MMNSREAAAAAAAAAAASGAAAAAAAAAAVTDVNGENGVNVRAQKREKNTNAVIPRKLMSRMKMPISSKRIRKP